jgi:glycosyl transferase family 2
VRYVIYAVWLVPLAELVLLLAGQANFRFRFRRAPGKFRLLIVQVTTTGREQERVREIIALIRGYRLSMPHEIWVVTEPGNGDSYPDADKVLTVPADFTARARNKARALEYSRQVRSALDLDTADVKILFNDDDVLPTRGYLETAFAADYDVCEGITAPRAYYGGLRPLGHFFSCHADDMRTRGCLIYCSVFQGLVGKPLHIHGEGLTVTGRCERIVGWDRPVFASEDLVFGQNAVKAGMRWGWFHEYVELTSPWTVRDFFTQRKRWFWGNVHAVTHRDALPLSRALPIAAKWVFGSATVLLSTAGLLARLTGHLPPHSPVYNVSKLAILTWLVIFAVCGWIGASSAEHRRNDDSRLLNALGAVIMAPVSSLLTLTVITIALWQGNPRTFQVIRKTRESSQ